MVRLPTDRSDRIEPRSRSPKLPYNEHPIYQLRKWLVIIAIIGLLLSLTSYGPYGVGPILGFVVLLLALSIFLALADLTTYAMHKVQNPDQNPVWPRKTTMILDVVLCVLLQLSFWFCMGEMSWGVSYGDVWVFGAYAALMAFVCSLIHFYSFWKQLMARYKEKWLSSVAAEPCARCGYLEVPGETTVARHTPHPPHNTFTYAGPSAGDGSAALTPESTESNVEEGLLIGSDFEYRDEPAEEQELTIDQTEQVVATKGKGKKKKAVGKPLPSAPDLVDESYKIAVENIAACP